METQLRVINLVYPIPLSFNKSVQFFKILIATQSLIHRFTSHSRREVKIYPEYCRQTVICACKTVKRKKQTIKTLLRVQDEKANASYLLAAFTISSPGADRPVVKGGKTGSARIDGPRPPSELRTINPIPQSAPRTTNEENAWGRGSWV